MGMLNKLIQRNSTSQILEVFAMDATDKGVSGITFGNVVVRYFFRGLAGSFVTLTPINNPTVNAYLSLGWKEVDSTNLKGVYQFGLPDAVLANAGKEVIVKFEFTSGTTKDIWMVITLTDLENVLLANEGLDKVIIENQANLANCNGKRALKIMLGVLAGNTVGAGTSDLQFKPAGAEQSDATNVVECTLDSNNDRSEIVFP